jgi:starch-binding outer membrane protein, SusD/RagB family
MKKIIKKYLTLMFATSILMLHFSACKKFVQVDVPINRLTAVSVFNSDASATAAITGIYGNMYGNNGFAGQFNTSTSLLCGLSSDELTNFSTTADLQEFYRNELSTSNATIYNYFWGQAYQDIYDANAVLEGLTASTAVSSATKDQLSGEAKFIRAFCYFYLINFFGEVPLITSTAYQNNAGASRNAVSEVYTQIIADLKDADNLLAADYSFSAGERIRPNRSAADALLARVYLFTGDWSDAETESSMVINDPLYSMPADPDSVFLANSAESIWQLQPVNPGYNTNEGNGFILTSTPDYAALSSQLLSAFESGDIRRVHWVDSIVVGTNIYFFPFKYKVKTGDDLSEYSTVFRLAEQYLIRAEARAEQNKIALAQTDLNIIRTRAGLPANSSSTQTEMINSILHERQVELFTEWGHRWFDLKRTVRIDSVMQTVTSQKGGSWNTNSQLYPIPRQEILNDPNLTQNPGY